MRGGDATFPKLFWDCLLSYGPADHTATHCLLLQEIRIGFGFTLLVAAHPGSPGQNPESRNMDQMVVEVIIEKLVLTFSSASRFASAVCICVCMSVCLSVCLSVTS